MAGVGTQWRAMAQMEGDGRQRNGTQWRATACNSMQLHAMACNGVRWHAIARMPWFAMSRSAVQ
eukprot:11171054-Lingulodinium_polyedra.AAC.1